MSSRWRGADSRYPLEKRLCVLRRLGALISVKRRAKIGRPANKREARSLPPRPSGLSRAAALEILPNRKWLTCTEALDYLGSQLEVSNRDAAILLRDAFLEGRIRTRVDTEFDDYEFWRHATILPPFASNRFGPPLVRFDVSAEDLVGVWPTIVKKQPNELPESEWLPAKEAIYWVSRRLGASAVAASELINDRLSSGVIKSRERRWLEGNELVDETRQPRPVDQSRWGKAALRPDGMITSRGIDAGIPVGSSTFPLIEVCFADLTRVWPPVIFDTTSGESPPVRGRHRHAFPRNRESDLVGFICDYYARSDAECEPHNQEMAREKAEAHFGVYIPRGDFRQAFKRAGVTARPGRPRRNRAKN